MKKVVPIKVNGMSYKFEFRVPESTGSHGPSNTPRSSILPRNNVFGSDFVKSTKSSTRRFTHRIPRGCGCPRVPGGFQGTVAGQSSG